MEEKKFEPGSFVYVIGEFNYEVYTVIKANKEEDSFLIESGDGSRLWMEAKHLMPISRAESLDETRLVIKRPRESYTSFEVHFNEMVADGLNFEEMLGCVIRAFTKYQGVENQYLYKQKKNDPIHDVEYEQ
jgi:hypothetical protein